MNFEPEAYSLRWYRQMVGISSIGDTTVVTNKWMLGTRNSFFIGICCHIFSNRTRYCCCLRFKQTEYAIQSELYDGNINFTDDCSVNYYISRNVFLLFKNWINSYLFRINSCPYSPWNTICGYYSYCNFNWF